MCPNPCQTPRVCLTPLAHFPEARMLLEPGSRGQQLDSKRLPQSKHDTPATAQPAPQQQH